MEYNNHVSYAIHIENLTKTFGNFTAVNNISFDISQGEIFGLLGPNGAGKTTTIKMLCTLLIPSSGKAEVDGHDVDVLLGDDLADPGQRARAVLQAEREFGADRHSPSVAQLAVRDAHDAVA